MRNVVDGIKDFLILRKPRSGCLEERTALIQPGIAEAARFLQQSQVPRWLPSSRRRSSSCRGSQPGGRRDCPTGPSRTAVRASAPAVLVKPRQSSASPCSNGRATPATAPDRENAVPIWQFFDRRHRNKTIALRAFGRASGSPTPQGQRESSRSDLGTSFEVIILSPARFYWCFSYSLQPVTLPPD